MMKSRSTYYVIRVDLEMNQPEQLLNLRGGQAIEQAELVNDSQVRRKPARWCG